MAAPFDFIKISSATVATMSSERRILLPVDDSEVWPQDLQRRPSDLQSRAFQTVLCYAGL